MKDDQDEGGENIDSPHPEFAFCSAFTLHPSPFTLHPSPPSSFILLFDAPRPRCPARFRCFFLPRGVGDGSAAASRFGRFAGRRVVGRRRGHRNRRVLARPAIGTRQRGRPPPPALAVGLGGRAPRSRCSRCARSAGWCTRTANNWPSARPGQPRRHQPAHAALALLRQRRGAGGPNIPEAAGQPLRYYPGVDLFQSLLLLVGADDSPCAGVDGARRRGGDVGGAVPLGGQLHGGRVSLQRRAGGIPVFPPVPRRRLPARARLEKLAADDLRHATAVSLRAARRVAPAHRTGARSSSAIRRPAPRRRPITTRRRSLPRRRRVTPGVLPFWVEVLLYATLPVFHLFAFVFAFAAAGLVVRRVFRADGAALAPVEAGRRGAGASDGPARADDRQRQRGERRSGPSAMGLDEPRRVERR